jgi:hypothetical protein
VSNKLQKEVTALRLEVGQYKRGCAILETTIDLRNKRIAYLEDELADLHTRIDAWVKGEVDKL